MKKKLIIGLLIISSCSIEKSKVQDSIPRTDNLKNKVNEDYFLSSNHTNKPDAKVRIYRTGEVYKEKVFLNSNSLYSKYNLKPKFYLKKGGKDDTISTYKPLISVGDTGYVEFIINDDFIKEGEEKIKTFTVDIVIPLPEKDTIFTLLQEYIYKK